MLVLYFSEKGRHVCHMAHFFSNASPDAKKRCQWMPGMPAERMVVAALAREKAERWAIVWDQQAHDSVRTNAGAAISPGPA